MIEGPWVVTPGGGLPMSRGGGGTGGGGGLSYTGCVIVRQRRGMANGYSVFSIEDETGSANDVVRKIC